MSTGPQTRLLLDDPTTGMRASLVVDGGLIDPDDADLSDISFGPDSTLPTFSFNVNGTSGDLYLHSLETQADTTRAYFDGVGFAGKLVTFHQIATGGEDWIIAAPAYGNGLSSYRTGPDGTPILAARLDDTAALTLKNISAIDSLRINGTDFILAASSIENAINVLQLGPQGQLSPIDKMTAANHLPIDTPTALQTVTINDKHFVVTASFGTGSLTVLEVSGTGDLSFVDQINDTRETRFGGTSALDIITFEGRTYIAAAGNDMGVSLFQMVPDGRLIHLETFVDQLTTALDGISDLRFVDTNGTLELYALSTRDAGLTRLEIATDPAGATGDLTYGTEGQDIISAADGEVAVWAYGGNDILMDTPTTKQFFGGDGADVFVFIADGIKDTIRDLDPTQDKIDLSNAGNIYSVDDLDIRQFSDRFRIAWDDEVLHIRTDTNPDLTYEELVSTLTFATDRVSLIERAPLTGTASNDTFVWIDGDDTVDGGDGVDHIDYSAAPVSAYVDLADSSQNALAAQGDILTNIEGIIGTAADDVIMGDQSANNLWGGDGDDELFGGAGSDWLMPGNGGGSVDGGSGTDMLSLSDLSQSARVSLTTQTVTTGGNTVSLDNIENITGTIFADVIEGDSGDNRLRGLGDYDWFLGTEGADSYDGGSGRDMISYVYADGAVQLDLGTGVGLSGLAAGDSYVSIERVTGSIYNDVVYGGDGDEDIRGVGGYDWFIGSPGRDRFDGGAGDDTIAYWTSSVGVSASLSLGYGWGGDATRDLYTSIENLTGSSYGDALTGDNGRNVLRGLGGDDELHGYGGVDRLEGGAGNDMLDGGWGWDVAIFSGARSEYDVALGPAGLLIVTDDQLWRDGVDTLENIEALQFSDGLFYF